MLGKLNKNLRILFVLLSGLAILFKLMDNKDTDKEYSKEGFQTQEFDDIW